MTKKLVVVCFFLIGFSSLQVFASDPAHGEITGCVYLSDGETAPGVTVSLKPGSKFRISDAKGQFSFKRLLPGSYTITAKMQGFEDQSKQIKVLSGSVNRIKLSLEPVSFRMDTIVVTGSYSIMEQDPELNVTLDKETVQTMPHVADDLFRVIGCLPGVSSNDMSSKFSIRGGLNRDNLVLLDGIEIFEPFHMKEYGGIISIVDPEVVGNMNLIPGGFTAEYGDRSSGVLEIDSLDPHEYDLTIGSSFSTLWLNSSGTFNDSKGYWLFSVRRGFLDLVMKLAGAEEDGEKETIRYWDTLGKIGYKFNPDNDLSLTVLAADDSMDLEENEPDEFLDLTSNYGNAYAWLKHVCIINSHVSMETRVYTGRVTDERDVLDIEHGDSSEIKDDRTMDLYGAKQDFMWEIVDNHYLKFGWEYRRFEADYDYLNEFDFDNSIPDDRFIPSQGRRQYKNKHKGSQYSGYVSDQLTLWNRFSVEAGARFDHYSVSDEDVIAPRINLMYDFGKRHTIRASYGQYFQSHKANELDIQDGDDSFYKAEKTHQISAGYEGTYRDDFRIRCEAYYRKTGNPRPRYVNLFDPSSISPEARPDRVRLEPTESIAKGIELFMSNRHGSKFDWWVNYTISSSKDTIDGKELYRNIDQTHALKLAMNYHPSKRWDINMTWHYHTGWPETRVTAEYMDDGTGEQIIVPVVGDFYNERCPAYHRLDLRVNYKFPLAGGEFTTFIDVQNLYNRENTSGFSFEGNPYRENSDGTVDFIPEEETWLGILPSFGVKYSF